MRVEQSDIAMGAMGFSPSDSRILVADDDPSLRLSFRVSLETEGYLVETASNGEEALERVRDKQRPPLSAVLLDLRMPGMDGMSVIRETRDDGIRVPGVIASAYIDSPTAVEAVDLGIVDFLQKPVTPADVRGVIDRVVGDEARFHQSEGDNPSASRFRCLLRRGRWDEAAEILKQAPFADGEDNSIWKILVDHLRACRDSESGKTEFASSRFYNAADFLGMLAYNRNPLG